MINMKPILHVFAVVVTAFLVTFNIQAEEGEKTMTERTSVILINPFTVPEGKVEEAIVLWEAGRDFLARQPGYISTKLHQSITPDAQYQLINVAEWESIETFKAATTKMRALPDLPLVDGVSSAPQLYDVIRN